jgi:RHS repeat-associated protein
MSNSTIIQIPELHRSLSFFIQSVCRLAVLTFVSLCVLALPLLVKKAGAYELPEILNPLEPDCENYDSGGFERRVFAEIVWDDGELDDYGANLSEEDDQIRIVIDPSQIPDAPAVGSEDAFEFPNGNDIRYVVQYIDDDYFEEDEEWVDLPGSEFDEFIYGEAHTIYDKIADTGYQVEYHRYYRLVAFYDLPDSTEDVIIYVGDRTTESNSIASMLKRQAWLVTNMDGDSDWVAVEPRVLEEFCPDVHWECGEDFGSEESLYYSQNWIPLYTTDKDREETMILDKNFSLSGYYETEAREYSIYSTVNRNDSSELEFKVTNPEIERDFDPSIVFLINSYLWKYDFDVGFADFRGDLSLEESALLDLNYEEPVVYLTLNIALMMNEGIAPMNEMESYGKLEIDWEQLDEPVFEVLEIFGYDPVTGETDSIGSSSVYTIEPDDYEAYDNLDYRFCSWWSGISRTWAITPGESLPSNNEADITITVWYPDGSVAIEKTYTIKFAEDEDLDERSTPDYYNIPFSTATGPKYRKIGLNGRPLSDEKPQSASENDEAKEETYVDAFNLNLVHNVTDIYVPIQGSELALSLRRNLVSEIWNLNSGLRPNERPDAPFGMAWSSNVCSNVKVIEPKGDDIDTIDDPVKAYVTDENGSVHEFVQYDNEWFPLPSASHEARAYLTSLEGSYDEGIFTFKQKHGNTLKFSSVEGEQKVSRDRVEGSQNYDYYTYARLDAVTDRLGYQLVYTYAADSTLIPTTIHAQNSDGEVIPNLSIEFEYSNGRINKAWDPNRNVIDYSYVENDYRYVLDQVDFADESYTSYSYETVLEESTTPKNYADIVKGEPPYEDPIIDACDSNQQHVEYFHVNLTSIEDANGNIYGFTYDFDHSKEVYVYNRVADGYFVQTGSPRNVTGVTLPNETFVSFENGNNDDPIRITASGEGYTDASITNARTNSVTDAEGFTTTYTFSGMEIEILKQFKDLLIADGQITADTRYKDPRILYYTDMTIDHGVYGSETYTFDQTAGLALKTVTDLSDNLTTYTYSDPISVDAQLSVWPDQYGFYNDPNTETHSGASDSITATKTFTYDPTFRIMAEYTDPEGRKTVTDVDEMGRRIDEKIYAPSDLTNPVQHTTFDYDDTWAGVVTTQTVKTLAGDPSWAVDIVTVNDLDSNGRIETSYSYPLKDASVSPSTVPALTTAYTYDDNNNRLTVSQGSVGSTGKTTAFTYDERNRLKTVTNPDATVTRNYYDLRGNLITTIDENGHATVNQYDEFNRQIATIRIMGETFSSSSRPEDTYEPDTDDLVTSYTYNNVNSLLETSVLDGTTTTMTYDDIQRVTSSLISGDGMESQLTTFEYGTNSGGSVFDSSGFQPTLRIDPRGYRTEITYDSLYRPITTRVEYDDGLYATTHTEYDLVDNPIRSTDPLTKVTETDYDALNRPILVTFADATTVITAYTATGLAYSVTDQLTRTTLTEYDGAGRPIKSIQPQVPVFGAVDSDSPITRTYYDAYGNISKTVNPLGEEWTTQYDLRNRPTIATQPTANYIDEAGQAQTGEAFTETTYDDVGNVLTVTDARGNVSVTEYDAANRAVFNFTPTVEYWDGSSTVTAQHLVTKTRYDRAGHVLETWSGYADAPSSSSATFSRRTALNTYDALGRLLTTTDAQEITVINTYDLGNNLISVTDGKSQLTTYSYDGLNRLLTTTYGGSDTTTLLYNAVNMTQRTDANGDVTTYQYDDRHRLTDVLYAGAASEDRSYTYDLVGNILTVTEPGKAAQTNVAYSYDALNRIVTETSSGITHQYQYDLAGNRRQTIYDFGGANARTLTATYDALNRTETIIEGERTSRYAYDLAGNIREKEQGNGDTIQKTYDALGRILTITGPDDSDSALYTSTNTYDLYGNLARMVETYPGGELEARTITNTYDGANRLLTEAIAQTAGTIITTYGYDDAHNRTSKTVSDNGSLIVNESYSYSGNTKNQLQSFTDQLSNIITSYSYDANGNRKTRSTQEGEVSTYTYDRENRLVQLVEEVTASGEPESQYINIYPGTDASHSELSIQATYFTAPTTEKTYTYAYDYRTRRVLRDESDAGGISTQVTFSGGTSVQEYTNLLVTDMLADPDYDGNENLLEYAIGMDPLSGNQSATFFCDCSGYDAWAEQAIVQRMTPEAIASYEDNNSELVVEYIRGSDYGGGIGGILYSLRSGAPSFKHYNSRGDVVAATDASGSLTYQAAYEAFGKHGDTSSSQEWGSTDDRQQANTKDEDPTGLLNEGFRYRDLETGTFITRDPLGFVDGPNVYTYVVQNPWTKFDPLGLYVVYVQSEPVEGESYNEVNEFTPSEAQTKNFNNALQNLAKSGDLGAALVSKIQSDDYRFEVKHTPGGSPEAIGDQVSLDLNEPSFVSDSAREQAVQNLIDSGQVDNEKDAKNQMSTSGAVVLAHEAGHAILGRKDEPAGGDNVQSVENVVRDGLGEAKRENYHQTPVPQKMSPESAEKNRKFIEENTPEKAEE